MTTYYHTKSVGKIVRFETDRAPDENGFVWTRGAFGWLGKNVFTDKNEAVAAAIRKRDKRVLSLRRQADDLERASIRFVDG